jgi:hypothetical protein
VHTATQLERSLFSIRLAGEPAEREDVFPDWSPRDRLGVIVHEPFGGVGASHLIQLATTAFYDIRPSRRDESRIGPHGEVLAQYADIYLFHVGGDWGDHSYFDIWPPRKEVRVRGDARDVLDAVLDRAITWLAVPDATPEPIEHFEKDPAEAYDRMQGAFAYSASGRVADGEVEIAGKGERTEFNPQHVLDPDGVAASVRAYGMDEISDDPELRRRDWQVVIQSRTQEARHGLERAVSRRQAIRNNGASTETYRRISVHDALWMLTPASG